MKYHFELSINYSRQFRYLLKRNISLFIYKVRSVKQMTSNQVKKVLTELCASNHGYVKENE